VLPGKPNHQRKWGSVSILWIILIVVLVLALLGYFGRGRQGRAL
jgi:flagellar basal body-associated protein FliL